MARIDSNREMDEDDENAHSPLLQAELEENFGLLPAPSTPPLSSSASSSNSGGRIVKPKITTATVSNSSSGFRRVIKVRGSQTHTFLQSACTSLLACIAPFGHRVCGLAPGMPALGLEERLARKERATVCFRASFVVASIAHFLYVV